MFKILTAAFALSISTGMATAATPLRISEPLQEFEHGGGCRKSSPPGQCCHMDNSVGMVHCH
jgi:hypothetical protein